MIRPQRLEEESREPELSKITEIASGEFAARRLAGTPRSLDKREQRCEMPAPVAGAAREALTARDSSRTPWLHVPQPRGPGRAGWASAGTTTIRRNSSGSRQASRTSPSRVGKLEGHDQVSTTPEPPQPAAGTELGAFTAHIDATPLGRINQLAVDHLTLTVPSTLIDGDAPVVPLTLLDLRIRLLRRSTPGEVRDRAWRHIGQLARAERGDWNLFALGLAYPGLRARAWRLTEGLSFHQAAQVHFRLAGEFLFALHRLDLDKPNVASRLIGAAYDQATGRKKRAEPVIIGLDGDTLTGPDEIAYSRSEDGPRRVLDRLVSRTRSASDGQQITELHATLIARTYLDGDKLKQVAADLGMSESNASKHRTRAEALIARQLGRPGLVGQPLSAYLDLSQEDLRLRRELQRYWIWPQRTARDRLAPVLQRQHNPVVQLSNGLPRFSAVVVDLHAMLVQVIGADQH